MSTINQKVQFLRVQSTIISKLTSHYQLNFLFSSSIYWFQNVSTNFYVITMK